MTLLGAVAASRRRTGGATLLVPLATETVSGIGNYSQVVPGDTLVVESGTRGRLVLEDLVGTADQKITVIDDGGVVNLDGGGDPGVPASGPRASLDIGQGCQHLRVVTTAPWRIRAFNSERAITIRQDEDCEWIEVAGVEGFNTTGNPGLHTGSGVRASFPRQRGIWLHDLWIHDVVDSEGIYLGSSTWTDGGTATEMDGVVVENCLVEDCDYDGIQIGSVAWDDNVPGGYTRNACRGNTVLRCGQLSTVSPGTHTKGIVINRGCIRLDIVDNWVEEAGEEGIYDQGIGGGLAARGNAGGYVLCANNVVVRSGQDQVQASEGDGILVAGGDGDTGDYHVVHNTVVDGTGKGIDPGRTYGANTIRNNIVAGNTVNQIDTLPAEWTATNNLTAASVTAGWFVGYADDNFHLAAAAAPVDAGVNLETLPVAADIDGNPRPGGAVLFPAVAGFAQTVQATNTTTHAGITIPAHQAGDTILLLSGADGDNTLSTVSAVNGAAWQVAVTSGVGSNAISAHAAWVRAAVDSAATTVTATFTDAEMAVHHVYVLRDTHPTSPVEAAVVTPATNITYDPPNLTASWGSDKNLWFAGVSADDTSLATTVATVPAGYGNTNSHAMAINGGVSFATCRRELEAAAEDPGSASLSEAEQFAAFTVVVRGYPGWDQGAYERPAEAELLTWAPPGYPDFVGYQTVTSAGGAPFFDFEDTPTILEFTGPTTQKFSIRSNTHVVIRGFEHIVDTTVNGPAADGREFCAVLPSSASPGGSDPGRVVHFEGGLVHGYYCAGDLQVADPNAIVQIQNCRFEQGMWADDAIDATRNHPDVFQPYGGSQEIRVDKVTARVTYQGFIIGQSTDGPVTVKRTNFEAQDPNDSTLELSEQPSALVPNYVVHASAYFGDPGALLTLDRVSFRTPVQGQQLSVVANGQSTANLGRAAPYDGWAYDVTQEGARLALDFSRSTADWVGKLYEGAPFTVGGGDWVSAGDVGVGYVPPGYQGV